jgi:tetrahydromethanopterin S-methyltransferase subunit C
MLDQPNLSRFLADLIASLHRKLAVFCERVPIVEAVRQVANIHLGPGLPELASIEGSLVLGVNDVSISATE